MKFNNIFIGIVIIFLLAISSCNANNNNTDKIQVSFNVDGGSLIETKYIDETGLIEKPIDPVKEGYIFVRWELDGEPFDFTTLVTTDITLVAIWEEVVVKEFTVSFDTCGGTEVEQQVINENTELIKPTDPIKEGYIFVRWELNGEPFNFTTPIEGDVILVAIWEKVVIKEFTISFDTGGGTEVEQQVINENTELIKPTDPIKEGYIFVGWELNGEPFDFTTPIEGDVILVAIWEKVVIKEFTVSFDTCGGSEFPHQVVIGGQKVIKPSDPVKEGYIFICWMYNNQEFSFDTKVLKDITLVAKWELLVESKGLEYEINEDGESYSVIGIGVFEGANLVIPEIYNNLPITRIKSAAFEENLEINSVVFSKNIQVIEYLAFWGCLNLENIILNEGLISIGYGAFSFCAIKEINIPSTVKEIGEVAIATSSLVNINVSAKNLFFTEIDGVLFSKDLKSLIQYPAAKNNIYYETPDTTKNILVGSFAFSQYLMEIKISEGVESVQVPFYMSIGPKIVHLPNSIKYIEGIGEENEYSLSVYYYGTLSEFMKIEFKQRIALSIEHFYLMNNKEMFYELKNLNKTNITSEITKIPNYCFCGMKCLISIEIPSSVESIGNEAFSGCSNLTSIIIPSSVTSIGNSTFSNCSGLTSITIPNSVTNIGDYAFSNCSGLTSIEIPSSVASIGDHAFSNCSGLTSIEIPSSVASIGVYAFSECSGLISIEIPIITNGFYSIFGLIPDSLENVTLNFGTEVPFAFFAGAESKIKTIHLIDTITKIQDHAFAGFSSLESITFEEDSKLKSIGSSAFNGCSSLVSISLPNNLYSIGSRAFEGCNSLVNVILSDSLERMGNDVFEGCNNLDYNIYDNAKYLGNANNPYHALIGPTNLQITTCKFNDNVKCVASLALFGCTNLEKIEVPFIGMSGNDNYYNTLGDMFDDSAVYQTLKEVIITGHITNISDGAFAGFTCLTSIEIPNTVTSIGSSAFKGCSSLTKVIIPDGVTSIGESAFYGCSSLTEVIIPDGVTSIGDDIFCGCSSLTSITVPKGVTIIGNEAFDNCSSLTSITIPSSVTSIGYLAFYGCSSLKNVYYEGTIESWCNISFDGYKSNPMCYADHFYMKNEEGNWYEVKEIQIPNKITEIGNYQFYGFENVTTFNIPSSVTNIRNYSFYECSSLTSIIIPSSVTTIGDYVFENCSNLTIYCETDSQPKGWSSSWNSSSCIVYFGYMKIEK